MVNDKDRLKAVGKLIKVYRTELRLESQQEFTMKTFCKGICNFNTLKTIESGGLSRSNEIYEELLNKLGLQFGYYPLIDEALDKIILKLYIAIEYFDKEAIDQMSMKALRILEKVHDYIYYAELYQLIEDVRGNYLDGTMISTFRYNRYLQVIEIIDNKYHDLMLLLMFKWLQYHHMDDIAKLKGFIKDHDIEHSTYIPIKMILLYYYGVSSQYFKMRDVVKALETKLIENDNKARLLDVYSYGIIMSSYTDRENVYAYIHKQEDLYTFVTIPDFKKQENYMMIGNTLHYLKDYDKACTYYEKCLDAGSNIRLIDLIYLADCQNRLSKKVCIPDVEKDVLMKYPSHIQLMYNYFYYFDVPEFAKENYILKEIAPNLIDDELIKVFEFEIERLIESTGHYKALYTFKKKIQMNEQKQ